MPSALFHTPGTFWPTARRLAGLSLAFACVFARAQAAPLGPVAGPLDRKEFPFPPQAPAEDQGGVGFCWAYSLSSYFESNLKREGRNAPNLSEEYLGFYNLYEQLREPNPVLDWALMKRGFGFFMDDFLGGLGLLLAGPKEGSVFETALDRLTKYGIVPESIFRYKFQNQKVSLTAKVQQFLRGDYLKSKDFYRMNPDKLRTDLMEVFGAKVPSPNEEFFYNDRMYTPVTFARDFLGYKRSDYQVVQVNRDQNEDGIRALRDSFSRGESVPFAFTVLNDEASKHGGVFSTENCATKPCKFDGRHAVLAVNSVKDDGRDEFSFMPSFLSTADLFGFEEPKARSGGILIRNSWGATGVDKTPIYMIQDEYLQKGFDVFAYWEYVRKI